METPTQTTAKSININKPCYIAFLLIGIIFLCRKDFSQAVVFTGIALVFDPFNPQIPFQHRPFYQKAWLFVHLTINIILFVLMLIWQ